MADLRDCLWVVPTRARPTRLRFMLAAGLRLSGARTDFAVCTDDDDPCAAGYAAARDALEEDWPGRVTWQTGPRDTLAGWTNRVALSAAGYRAVGSMGDDHMPRPSRPGTGAWDVALLAALPGAGLAYGDDLHSTLPTAWLASREVIAALGWMILPGVEHYFGDNAVRDLGARLVPGVIIEHRHPLFGGAPADRTYIDAGGWYDPDQAVYGKWRGGQMAADQATVRAAAG